jgi:hypothetical protein
MKLADLQGKTIQSVNLDYSEAWLTFTDGTRVVIRTAGYDALEVKQMVEREVRRKETVEESVD